MFAHLRRNPGTLSSALGAGRGSAHSGWSDLPHSGWVDLSDLARNSACLLCSSARANVGYIAAAALELIAASDYASRHLAAIQLDVLGRSSSLSDFVLVAE